MPRRDEDALSWEGDDDPTLDTGGPAPEPIGPSGSATPESTPAAAVREAPLEPEPEPEALGTVSLVALGVLGGVYLLFAIGWLLGGLRLQGRYPILLADAMYQGALWLATAAPLIWFATTLFATRRTRAWVRWLWLALGVLLLIPWPFLMMGAVGR